MADQAHLDILKQGVSAWNVWRKSEAFVRPDLSGASLSGEDLSRADLGAVDLSGAYLIGTDLRWVDLREADLRWADLFEANLYEANLHRASLHMASLRVANLRRADLHEADLREAHFDGADLREADLHEANLWGANCEGADFEKANLGRASLVRADLRLTDLRDANLNGADLSDANIIGADLSGAYLGGASFWWTILGNTDLSMTRGLESAKHRGPSIIGLDTIYRSEGNVSESFLRGAGVPDDFIRYMISLVSKPIEFYSCFISYSSKDEAFAKRLYADLQSRGVRCWFAPEDMKIGAKIRDTIDTTIRVHDKLLIILSGNSILSDWVETEVETAFEEEHKRGTSRRADDTVLFPVRLDDAVMNTDEPWAAEIRRTRHIGDFTQWKDSDSYPAAFDRLMRDLKSGQRQADL